MRGGTRAGKRRFKIAFKRYAESEDAMGAPVKGEAEPLGNERAFINYGKGSERREAGIEGNDLPATFNVLRNSVTGAVTAKDVIEYDGAVWDITSIVPWETREIDFTAIRRM